MPRNIFYMVVSGVAKEPISVDYDTKGKIEQCKVTIYSTLPKDRAEWTVLVFRDENATIAANSLAAGTYIVASGTPRPKAWNSRDGRLHAGLEIEVVSFEAHELEEV